MDIQQERNATSSILDSVPKVTTIHYDTTMRKRLNGEWPSLVLKTKGGSKFRMQSLNMAFEDRQNV